MDADCVCVCAVQKGERGEERGKEERRGEERGRKGSVGEGGRKEGW